MDNHLRKKIKFSTDFSPKMYQEFFNNSIAMGAVDALFKIKLISTHFGLPPPPRPSCLGHPTVMLGFC